MLALQLAEIGMHVFPCRHEAEVIKEKTYGIGTPLLKEGFYGATTDPDTIKDWWKKYPNALVGVYTGPSNILVIDIDVKVDAKGEVTVDGFETLSEEFLPISDTFNYDSRSGLGQHRIYRAPEGLNLNRQTKYRGLSGVDRLAGDGYIVWAGPVPAPNEIKPSDDWMNDEASERVLHEFEGDLARWYENLVPGSPNALVRRAIEKIDPDMSHSEMVAAQHAAIRLGAEGNSGVPDLLEAIREAWETRPAENHTTPEEQWGYKFEEALTSGLEKYGEVTELFQNLPEYNLALVPTSVPDHFIVGPPGKSADFSKALGALVREIDDDLVVTTILWNSPVTSELARDWGLEFTYRRVIEARTSPEPTRENPKIEAERAKERETGEVQTKELLTEEEREYVAKRPTFVDNYLTQAKSIGFANEKYTRAAGWAVASMAFSFHGYFPVTATDRMNCNLWIMILGESGTGKTRAIKLRDAVLRRLFDQDNPEGVPYDLGTDSSIEGLHEALLGRDRLASLFASDEASRFFKKLTRSEWTSGTEDVLAHWYEGQVDPSNKVRLKELKGKSATTSLISQMFATPKRLTDYIDKGMFESGFLARYAWVIGDPPRDTSDRFNFSQVEEEEIEDFDEVPEIVDVIVADLIAARSFAEGNPVPLLADREAAQRLSEAHERMYRMAQGDIHWDMIEPSITRLAESMRKMAGICAMYRSDSTINIDDALHAIKQAEEWYVNLFEVTKMVSAGEFQHNVDLIEAWVRARGGKASKAAILAQFKDLIRNDPRELDAVLNYLVESGSFNRVSSDGAAIKYEVNGG